MADGISGGANAVGEALSDGCESVGNWMDDLLGSVDAPVLGSILRWLGGILSSAFDCASSGVKGVCGFLGGSFAGCVKLIAGLLTLAPRQMKECLIDIAASLAGAVVLVAGKLVACVQSLLGPLLGRNRRLTAVEIADLKRVFRSSLAYYNIRVVEGFAGLFSTNDRPFALGDTIYLKNCDVTREPEKLVHECVHVWQYQHVGVSYSVEALVAQTMQGSDAYDWQKQLLSGKGSWVLFNREAQAQLIQDVYSKGELMSGPTVIRPGGGGFYDADGTATTGRLVVNATDYTVLANDATNELRGHRSVRLSSRFS